MNATAAERIEADVKYKKWLWIFDDWNVGPRNANSTKYFSGKDIHFGTGTGQYEVVFHVDSHGHNLHWAAEPIWVQRGSCPESVSSDPEICNPVVDPAAETLTIRDTVSTPGELHYSLNFVSKNGKSKRYDPIIIHD